MPISGSQIYKVYYRLKLLMVKLRAINRRDFDKVSVNVSQCRNELVEIKNRLMVDPFNIRIQQEEKEKVVQLQKLIN